MKFIYNLYIILLLITSCINTNNLPYVIGSIKKIELVDVPNKAKDFPSKKETRIDINIDSAYNEYGKLISKETFDYPNFAGDSTLINQYKVGDKVKIVCSSNTGRHIKSIERLK